MTQFQGFRFGARLSDEEAYELEHIVDIMESITYVLADSTAHIDVNPVAPQNNQHTLLLKQMETLGKVSDAILALDVASQNKDNEKEWIDGMMVNAQALHGGLLRVVMNGLVAIGNIEYLMRNFEERRKTLNDSNKEV